MSRRTVRRCASGVLALVAAAASPAVAADPDPPARGSRVGVPLDRAVVRFAVRETGGAEAPRFVFERELAFEARMEALADRSTHAATPYHPRHVRAALERHVAETVLASLDVDPRPTDADIGIRVEQARLALAERVGGLAAVAEAASVEGITPSEQFRLLRRQALASLYLDRMVAPMLVPSPAELRAVHRTERTPFSGRPLSEVEPALRRWLVGTRLAAALSTYYDGLRTRLELVVLR